MSNKTEILMGQVRALTAAVGGVVVATDLITAATWDTYSGIALILATAAFSARSKWRAGRGESY